jgi:hypothetical protein
MRRGRIPVGPYPLGSGAPDSSATRTIQYRGPTGQSAVEVPDSEERVADHQMPIKAHSGIALAVRKAQHLLAEESGLLVVAAIHVETGEIAQHGEGLGRRCVPGAYRRNSHEL